MANFYQFDTRWRNVRGGYGSLPPIAQTIVGIFAIPGIVLAILSLVLFAVSMLALLVLTVPVYRLLSRLTQRHPQNVSRSGEAAVVSPFSVVLGAPAELPSSGTRRVDSTVVESAVE